MQCDCYNLGVKKYKISVITPFNNTDLKLFDRCTKHMLKQTIGFENVEWIVIIHNCKDGYYEKVKKRIGMYDNVVLKKLKNDVHSASSPRNYALDLVTGDYLLFLDSDDFLSNDCLEVAYNTITETKSQIVGFRRSFVASKQGLFPMVDDILWNSAEKLIVADKNNWNEEAVFYRDFLFVTSHIFDSKFIQNNHYRFDEDIILAEDMHFMLQLIPKLNRIAFLPQLIGYVYYLHDSSMIQNNVKTDEQLLSFARGFKKIYDIDKQYGTQSLALYSCLPMLANYILGSTDVKVETRIEIKKLLEEAVSSSADKIKDKHYRKLSKAVIMNPVDPWKSEYVINFVNGQNDLIDILHNNVNSDFGKYYHFEKISNLKAYQENVPLHTYADYKPIVNLYKKVGIDNILTKHKVIRFILKDNREMIPCTREYTNKYIMSFAEELRGKHNFLIARSKKATGICNNGATIRDLQSVIIRDYMFEYLDSLTKDDATFASRKGMYFVDGQDTDYYGLLKDALLDKNIQQIVALNTNEILNCFKCLELNTKSLIKDVAKINANRAKELRAIFKDGLNNVAIKIWPKLERVIGFGAGELYESNRSIKEYIGEVAHNHGYYFAEEATLGKSVSDNSDLFESSMSDCFYELLPIEKDTTNLDTVLLTDAVLHKTYQLVITNNSGLYRYVTDHFISIKEKNVDYIRYTVY